MSVLYCLDYHSFVGSFKIGKCKWSYCVLFQSDMNILGPLQPPYKFYNQFASFHKESRWDSDRDCAVPIDKLEINLKILSSDNEHEMLAIYLKL